MLVPSCCSDADVPDDIYDSDEDKAVRERAGGIVRELGNSRATRDTLLSWKGVVENVKSGPISRDDTNRAREAYKAVFQSDRPER